MTFSSFSAHDLPLFQDLIQDPTWHLIVMCPYSLPICDNSIVFPCLSWPRHFWRVLLSCFVECPCIWVCLIFSITIILKLRHLGHESHGSDVLSFFVSGSMMLISVVTGDVDFAHWIKVVTAKFTVQLLFVFSSLINSLVGKIRTPFHFGFSWDPNFSFSCFPCLWSLIYVQLMGWSPKDKHDISVIIWEVLISQDTGHGWHVKIGDKDV